jgi:hypothetical protein
MEAIEFKDNDQGYKLWVKENPNGYVLNCLRSKSPYYLVIHRSTCHTINNLQKKAKYWTKGYRKICSNDIKTLEDWAKDKESGHASHCEICNPK